MSALTSSKNIDQLGSDGFKHALKVAASTKIYAGGHVCVNAAGYAVPMTATTGLQAMGVASETVDNTSGAAGDKTVPVVEGVFKFKNSSSGDLIAQANINDTVYGVDDQTVALTDGTGARSAAGKVVQIDSDGVFVRVEAPRL